MTVRWLQLYCVILWLYLSLDGRFGPFQGVNCVWRVHIYGMKGVKRTTVIELLRFWYMSKMSHHMNNNSDYGSYGQTDRQTSDSYGCLRASSYEPGWPGWPGLRDLGTSLDPFKKISTSSYERAGWLGCRDLGFSNRDLGKRAGNLPYEHFSPVTGSKIIQCIFVIERTLPRF